MWDAQRNGERGGRLVMLGTPNHGSYLTLQTVCGLAGTIRKLAIVDQWHDTSEITRILNTFVGSFQMLPSPEREPAAETYYNARTYGDLNVPQSVLDVARAHHRFHSEVPGGERMVYIAGSNQPTLAGLSDPSRLRDPIAYLGTTQGDGNVSHALGLLKGVRTYFIDEEHSALVGNAKVIAALDDLMIKGTTDLLAGGQVVRGKPRMFKLARWADAGKAADEREAAELSRAQDLSRQLRRRIAPALRGSDKEATVSDSEAQRVSPNERVLRDLLTSSFLASKGPDVAATASLEKFRPTVVFRLFWGRIDEVNSLPAFNAGNSAEPLPVDAVSLMPSRRKQIPETLARGRRS